MKIHLSREKQVIPELEAGCLQQNIQRAPREVIQVPGDVIKRVPVSAKNAGLEAIESGERYEEPAAWAQEFPDAPEVFRGMREMFEHMPEGEGVESAFNQVIAEQISLDQPEGWHASADKRQGRPGHFDAGPVPMVRIQRPEEFSVAAAHIEYAPAPEPGLHDPGFFSLAAPRTTAK